MSSTLVSGERKSGTCDHLVEYCRNRVHPGRDEAGELACRESLERFAAYGGIERFEITDFARPEDLDQVRVDEIEMADEPLRGIPDVMAIELSRDAAAAAQPLEPQLFAIILKQPGYAEMWHGVAIRRSVDAAPRP